MQDLSQELQLTSVTVRHHLEILRSEGYITDPEIRRSNSPGRPRYVYRLTSTAADLFPNNYSGLAAALLNALQAHATPEEREVFLKEAAEQLAAGIGELPQAPQQRMEALVKYLKQLGFITRWEPDENGNGDYLYVCNCPYHYVAQRYPEICKLDEYMLAHLVAGSVLERLPGKAYEGELCRYRISLPKA